MRDPDLRPRALPLVLDAKDVAALLDVDERTAQRWIKAGKLGCYTQFGGKFRLRRDEFWRSLLGSTPRRRS